MNFVISCVVAIGRHGVQFTAQNCFTGFEDNYHRIDLPLHLRWKACENRNPGDGNLKRMNVLKQIAEQGAAELDEYLRTVADQLIRHQPREGVIQIRCQESQASYSP